MAIRKILVLVCDKCGEQEPTECQNAAEAKDAARAIGWKAGSKVLCRYCATIAEEQKRR